MSQAIEVKVPDIGDFKDIPVIEVLVKAGDTVKKEQSLVTVESDKATMDIPSSAAGVVKEVKVKVGDKVSEGSLIVVLEGGGARPLLLRRRPRRRHGCSSRAAPRRRLRLRAAAGGGTVDVKVPDIGDFKDIPVIEVAGEGRRHGQEGAVAGHARIRQGDDGRSVARRRRRQGTEGQGRRHGLRRHADRRAGRRLAALLRRLPRRRKLRQAPKRRSAVGRAAPRRRRSNGSAVGACAGARDARRRRQCARARHASPSVRKFARELGVDVSRGDGHAVRRAASRRTTSPRFVKGVMTGQRQGTGGSRGAGWRRWRRAWACCRGRRSTSPSSARSIAKPLSRIKKISGANLHRNWVMIPHVTNNDEADITDLEAFRVQLNKENEKAGVKVTMLAFVIKAVVVGAEEVPDVQREPRRRQPRVQAVLPHRFRGRYAERSGGAGDSRCATRRACSRSPRKWRELSKAARDGKLKPDQMQGGCFSISSLGGIGGTNFTPIINAPEVAILGLSQGAMKPVWDGKQFVPRLMLPLSLSYDHRVIDGAAAARFNAYLWAILADFRRVIL